MLPLQSNVSWADREYRGGGGGNFVRGLCRQGNFRPHANAKAYTASRTHCTAKAQISPGENFATRLKDEICSRNCPRLKLPPPPLPAPHPYTVDSQCICLQVLSNLHTSAPYLHIARNPSALEKSLDHTCFKTHAVKRPFSFGVSFV